MKEHEKPLKALANKRRLAILGHLKKVGEASVGDISGIIRVSFKATSRHLRILSAADIIEREQRNREAYYHLSKPLPPVAAAVMKYI